MSVNPVAEPTWKRPSHLDSKHPAWIDMGLIWVLSLTALVFLTLWYDNTQNISGNGMFKAIHLKSWVRDPAAARLDLSNYLYFPFMGRLCWLLDAFGIFPGDPSRQIPIINAPSAATSLVLVYFLVWHLTADRVVALLAALFHLAGAFFLKLTISNEDILPSYTLMLSSMVFAVLWFPQPSVRRVAIVSALFTLGWLFEWRLMFPTLPAMLLALTLTPGKPVARLAWVLIFLVTGLILITAIHGLWGSQPGNAYGLHNLIFTGKGLETGWAGFTTNKLWFLWIGIGESLLGGINSSSLSALPVIARELGVSTLIIVGAAVGALILLWQNQRASVARILATVFGGTFAVGELMNVYSQPQDPQMQINVMPWLTVAVALIAAQISQKHRRSAVLGFALLSLGILAYNIAPLAQTRGDDARWREALQRIEREVDPANTFLLVHGFEPLVSRAFYHWNGQWQFFDTLGPAPTPQTKFKLLSLVSGPVNHPRLTGQEMAAELDGEIERAMKLGYEVVAVNIWNWSRSQLEAEMSTVADAQKSAALYDMLHTKFSGTPLYLDPVAGQFVRLRRTEPAR